MASKITVGKIVATATETEWSQAYHAGGFTAVVSVSRTAKGEDESSPLAGVGKTLLDTLVSEYFTLTTKDLQTVKEAVVATIAKTPNDVTVGLVVAAVVKNVLYVVIANEGRVLLKRGEKLGMLLSVTPEDSEKVASVSGFLEVGDIVLLHTFAFGKLFTHDELSLAFENKSAEEFAEFFAPKVHGASDGNASALVFSYHEDDLPLAHAAPETPQDQYVAKEEKESAIEEAHHEALPGFEKPLVQKKAPFSHRQKLFLTITVILGIVLIGSIFVFQNRQQAAKQQALFESLYQPAKSKFDDAKGLLDLNKSLAIEDLQAAQQQLSSAKGRFSADSQEEKQITTLLSQVNATLADAQKVPVLTASKAADGASPFLTFAAKQTTTYITQDSTNFYTADSNAITQYDKKTNASKKLVINSGDWKSLGGFDTYFGNFYIADTKDGILKYVSGGGGYGKSTYFVSGVSPDLSKVVSISIDSSIWVLTSDGGLTKYTKGTQDSISVTGLNTPLSNPTQVATSADLNNVYILDKGNARVVVLKKDGSFVAQYASDTVKTTSLMDISEKDKKIYFLSAGTIYQLDLK